MALDEYPDVVNTVGGVNRRPKYGWLFSAFVTANAFAWWPPARSYAPPRLSKLV